MISVIVPVYNVGKYVGQCLESVIGQSFRDLEIIVVDDGSTDGSGTICDEYALKDERIRVYHTENRGLSAARNYGIDRASGEYIAFLDSDDWIELNMYEVLWEIAEQTGADIVTCRFYQEYRDKTEESSGPQEPFTVEGNEILHTYLFQRDVCQDSWNNLFKAELFRDLRFPEGKSFEDYAIKPELLQKAGKMVYTPACLLHYRNRLNSLSNSHSMKSLIDYWVVFHERFEHLGRLSEDYYRITLSDCIGAVGRMWRWYAGCSADEKRWGQAYLDQMQQFCGEHCSEVMGDPRYSKHTKWTCRYAGTQNPVVFRALYQMNKLYRTKNRNQYFAE